MDETAATAEREEQDVVVASATVEAWLNDPKSKDQVVFLPAAGGKLRAVLRASVSHPRAEDQVVELPGLFRKVHLAGVSHGMQEVRRQIKQAMGVQT